ncbi:rcc01693 family protein [Acidimangrovimonas sediminis]|uniref:rcc01693 family protein n=1 Tax=Acidimangrovimonas sediminis TaxID=2056283 RepID=UPI0018EC5CCE|nr:rcc01693 family protein [Acidimangrovimonas sediminis]
MKGGLDWPGLMRAGLGTLGLEPRAFWALTPVELMLMLGIGGGAGPLTRVRLEELAAAYPDIPGKKGRMDDDGPDGSGAGD